MQPTLKYRVNSIDILRGLIMIVMALDHTREFFHQPAIIADPLTAPNTTAAIYFTRWITHFCAPTFLFLSGVSAYLSSLKKTKKEAALFLIKRGAWLVLIEVTIICFGITFNPFYNFIAFQVIWAIGWSMIFLGLLILISWRAVFIVGLLLVFGHNLLDLVKQPSGGAGQIAWTLLFRARASIIPLDSSHSILVIYTILPWTGVMLLGYSIGYWFNKDFSPAKRQKLLLRTGLSLILLFIILRFTGVYGDPFPRQEGSDFLHSLFSFLNTNKYPPSLQYLCMTLGPSCLLLAALERVKTWWSDIASIYGNVPFFYYVLHFYLLHLVLVAIFFATGHTSPEIKTLPFFFRPTLFGFGLPVVYLIWLSVVAALYIPCRWFSRYKKTHNYWWLSFV